MIDWSRYKPPYPNLPPHSEETADTELRKKYDANFWAYHEYWLRAEGIENFLEWMEKVAQAFPEKAQDVRSFWEGALMASRDYKRGEIPFGNGFDEKYQDKVSSWASFCVNLQHRLKEALWI